MPAPFKTTHFNTILYCRQFAETLDFYKNLLELPVHMEKSWLTEFKVTDSAYLSIADLDRARFSPDKCDAVTLTFKVEDLDAFRNELISRGVEAPDIEIRWQARSFMVRDPEGHRLEFWA